MHVYFSSAGDTGRIEKYVKTIFGTDWWKLYSLLKIKYIIYSRRGCQCIIEFVCKGLLAKI